MFEFLRGTKSRSQGSRSQGKTLKRSQSRNRRPSLNRTPPKTRQSLSLNRNPLQTLNLNRVTYNPVSSIRVSSSPKRLELPEDAKKLIHEFSRPLRIRSLNRVTSKENGIARRCGRTDPGILSASSSHTVESAHPILYQRE